MPMIRTIAAMFLALVAIGCGTGDPGVPPTGIDLTIPIADLPGFAEIEAAAGEPPESTRLESIIDSFREALADVRTAADPAFRASAEQGWWEQLERGLISTYGAERAALILAWCEDTFMRRTSGGAT